MWNATSQVLFQRWRTIHESGRVQTHGKNVRKAALQEGKERKKQKSFSRSNSFEFKKKKTLGIETRFERKIYFGFILFSHLFIYSEKNLSRQSRQKPGPGNVLRKFFFSFSIKTIWSAATGWHCVSIQSSSVSSAAVLQNKERASWFTDTQISTFTQEGKKGNSNNQKN